MASYRKRGDKFQVRWRDPDGTERNRTVPTAPIAKALVREVEEAIGLGRAWEPKGAPPRLPKLTDIFEAFLREGQSRYARSTLIAYRDKLDVFLRWQASRDPELEAEGLTKRTLVEYYEHLQAHGRAPQTAALHIATIQAAWKWAANDDDYESIVPRPKVLRLSAQPLTPAIAPTWAEMDAVIGASKGQTQRLAIMLRFTGLRVGQVLGLLWTDLDLEGGWLTVRGELGKSRGEKGGRVVPLSPHLVKLLQSWDRPSEFLIAGKHRRPGNQVQRAWEKTGIRPAIWRQRSHHSFRKGFTSELKRAGADSEAVEYLVGHSHGIRRHYVDPRSLPVVAAVALIPPLLSMNDV